MLGSTEMLVYTVKPHKHIRICLGYLTNYHNYLAKDINGQAVTFVCISVT